MAVGSGRSGRSGDRESDRTDDLFGDAAPSERGEDPAADPPLGAAADRPIKDKDDHRLGHRGRLRSRFMDGGEGAVAEYELLELLLFRAIPRKDVKPLAKALIARFGDLAGVLSADPMRLREVDGLGDAAVTELKIVAAAGRTLARARVSDKPVLGAASAVVDYCRAAIGRSSIEEFRVLFLDRKNRLIADEGLGRGTVDQVAVYPREVVKRALELTASAVILVHNHPSGDATPSRADIELTARIVEAAKTMGVAVHDHIVVGSAGAESFRRLGLL